MSQHDMIVQNQSRTLFRQDVQNALQALASLNSGTGDPAATYAYELKIDTTPLPAADPIIYIRKGDNSAWVRWGYVDKTTGQAIIDDATDADTVDGLHAVQIGAGFAAGTKMLFYQNTAPTGWTINDTLDDKLVYITKGSVAGGQIGGGVHSTGSWTISGLAADSHILTAAEMPAHAHNYITPAWQMGAGGTSVYVSQYGNESVTGSAGSGNGHVHGVTHTPAWRPSAYCCIVCTKN